MCCLWDFYLYISVVKVSFILFSDVLMLEGCGKPLFSSACSQSQWQMTVQNLPTCYNNKQFRDTQSAEAKVGIQKLQLKTTEHLNYLMTRCCDLISLHPMLLCVCLPPSDLPTGSYIQEDLSRCSSLCEAGRDCCDLMASCKCGTHTGQYDCICEKGYYGKGLQHECTGRLDGCLPGSCCVSSALPVSQLRRTNLFSLSCHRVKSFILFLSVM